MPLSEARVYFDTTTISFVVSITDVQSVIWALNEVRFSMRYLLQLQKIFITALLLRAWAPSKDYAICTEIQFK